MVFGHSQPGETGELCTYMDYGYNIPAERIRVQATELDFDFFTFFEFMFSFCLEFVDG